VVVPLITGRLLSYAMQLPPELKRHPQEFSEGSDSADSLILHFGDRLAVETVGQWICL
jgi:hypothetical protein